MASSPQTPNTSFPLEKHLNCSICMDVFVEPVTTSCGHSFCKRCLNCNALYNDNTCPLCKQYLNRIPEVNIVLNSLLQELRSTRRDTSRQLLAPELTGAVGVVACDVCNGRKLKAQKSCLVCLASYCHAHLEGHTKASRLKGHKLVEPVENLDERACLTHGRPLELYNRREKKCICALCVEEGQEIVSVEAEWETKKSTLNNIKSEIRQRIERRKQKSKEIRTSLKVFQYHIKNEWSDVDTVLTSVMAAVEETQKNALGPLEERRLAVEKRAKEMTEELKGEVGELRESLNELERISDLEDHVDFLQTYSSLPDLGVDNSLMDMALDVSVHFGTFQIILKNMVGDIQGKLERLASIELQRILKFAVDVKLDPSTAHPRLIVSTDGKEVQDGGQIQEVPDGLQRFDLYASILGVNPLTSGKAYWQVAVDNKSGWDLGVASVDVNRKGKLRLDPMNGYWVLVHYEDKLFAAMTDPPTRLLIKEKPKMVGVFVDYKEGLVSFYDLKSSYHIYSFTACSFTGELRPYFSPHFEQNASNTTPLIISPVVDQAQISLH